MTNARCWTALALLAGTIAFAASPARAVPYASGVRNTGGTNWEFVLNEAADNVTVLRNGGNAQNLGALAAGRHSFDMTGFSTFDIQVAKSAPVGWTAISDDANTFTHYEQPSDVLVNTNPTHPLFGTIYVNNDRTNPTASGRAMGDGVYALTADMFGVDLPTRAALTDPNDVSAAKAPGWSVGPEGADLGATSAWRMTLDAAGNLIVSDWSDGNGGIKYASADLSSGGLILQFEDGIPPLMTNASGQEIHGSIVSRPYVTGSVGNNLVVHAMDEDLNPSGPSVVGSGPGNSVWKWNLGMATNYDQPPELVVNVGGIPPTSDFRTNFLDLNVGVLANAVYSPQHNKWYLAENRADGNQAGLIVVTPDSVDGNSPTLEWSSLQFSIDNNLDGHTGIPTEPAGDTTDLQDIFRHMGGGMELSPDGTKLYVHRVNHSSVNPVLGTTSNLPGTVLIIPLNANGIPDIQVAGGVITNMDSITTLSNAANATRRGLALDSAGNIYTTNNNSERLQVFSPGGNWLATTSSTGTFSVLPFVPPLNNADFDNDGDVDGADFLVWQRGLGLTGQPNKSTGDATGDGTVDAADLAEWTSKFGGPPAEAAAGAVAEPASAALVAFGVLAVVGASRRRRR